MDNYLLAQENGITKKSVVADWFEDLQFRLVWETSGFIMGVFGGKYLAALRNQHKTGVSLVAWKLLDMVEKGGRK